MTQDEDSRASNGEVVRRADLERKARRDPRDPRLAGYEGASLASAALAGDQVAFHDLAGLVLPGVTEHSEGDFVQLVSSEGVTCLGLGTAL